MTGRQLEFVPTTPTYKSDIYLSGATWIYAGDEHSSWPSMDRCKKHPFKDSEILNNLFANYAVFLFKVISLNFCIFQQQEIVNFIVK